MSIKVLVFESDAAFAGELRNELGKLGCSTCVVDDGTVGLQQASAERPDLILLSIELPRMNGFSVCNKLKKDAALKNVPLIIMSSESSEETFEQHRKLRTRAEDYVHKPIAFGELLQHIRTFVPMDDPVNDTSDADSIVIDDEISVRAQIPDLEEGTVIGTRPPPISQPPPPNRHIDADIDAFTESAFGMLQDNPRPVEPPPPVEQMNGAHDSSAQTRPPPSAARQSVRPTRPPADDAERIRLMDELERATSRVSTLEQEVIAAERKLTRLREEADAEVERKQKEIEELRARPPQAAAPAKPGTAASGVSTREFLDLREALNKKDKEILALKESVSSRDREIFEARDKTLAVERSLAEAEERILARDGELAELREQAEATSAQLGASQAALTELTARHEKTSTELESASERLAEERAQRRGEAASHEAAVADWEEKLASALRAAAEAEARHKTELDAAASRHQAALDEHEENRQAELETVTSRHKAELEEAESRRQAELERLAAVHEEALHAAKAEGDAARTQAVAAREKELRSEADGKLAALHRAHQDELARTKADLTQQMEAAKSEADAQLEAKEAELAQKHSEQLAADQARAAAQLEETRQQAAAELAQAREQFEARLADAQATAAVAQEQAAAVQRKLDATAGELEELDEAKRHADEENTTKIANLEERIAKVEAARDALQRDGAEAQDRITSLEAQLGVESARLQKAQAKWNADKGTLERAKDALAVALAQIDEVEARPLDS